MKKIPMRKCLATNESFAKKDLLRVVKTPDGEIKVDVTGKLNGKGAYISKSKEALEIARTRNVLGKALESKIPDDIYVEIERIINGQ